MYKKYSQKELFDTYESWILNSGKISSDLKEEIESRPGGMEEFQVLYQKYIGEKNEKKRLAKEVFTLSKEGKDLEYIKKNIDSKIIKQEELEILIEKHFINTHTILDNKKIDKSTITKTILGLIIGSTIGFVFLIILIITFKSIWWKPFIVVVYIINYQVIKLSTKKNRDNIIVFLGAFIGTVISLVITFLLLKNLFILQP